VFYFRDPPKKRVAPHMWRTLPPVRHLALGESGDASLTAQCKNSAGRWVAAPRPQKATRWKARVYIRGDDGIRQEIVRFDRTRREAEASLEAAVAGVLDRHIAHSADPSGNARFDERQAAHTVPRRRHYGSQRPFRIPGQRPNGPAAPGR
jgi:hypothetical protein